ncbi:hypothetical protein GFS31_04970 [Leptolyngbya sp. BL0902]|nr:hypothetical protein GFS31_04970 [Leptolyngbya sp. BL0902]
MRAARLATFGLGQNLPRPGQGSALCHGFGSSLHRHLCTYI